MKYQLDVFAGDVPIVTIDLDAGRNVLSADATHRYVLRADSGEPQLADNAVVVQILRRGDDLVVEGLPAQQSLQITDYFARCSGDQCSMQFASDGGSDSTTITPADVRWVHASTEGVGLTLSNTLQVLRPDQLAVAPKEIDASASPSANEAASVSTGGARESNAGSGQRLAVAENAAAESEGREPASDEGGGIGAGTILAGAVGVAALAGLAGGGGGDSDGTDTGSNSDVRPELVSARAEGADQRVSSDEVRSDGAWQVTGSANDATRVEISIRVSNNANTQADLVSTDQFAVDANGNWTAAYATSFFSGTQAGQITLTIVPIGSNGTQGSPTTQIYQFDGLTTAGPGDPSDPVVLTSGDLLELDHPILTEETSEADTQYGAAEQAQITASSPGPSLLQTEVRLSEI